MLQSAQFLPLLHDAAPGRRAGLALVDGVTVVVDGLPPADPTVPLARNVFPFGFASSHIADVALGLAIRRAAHVIAPLIELRHVSPAHKEGGSGQRKRLEHHLGEEGCKKHTRNARKQEVR